MYIGDIEGAKGQQILVTPSGYGVPLAVAAPSIVPGTVLWEVVSINPQTGRVFSITKHTQSDALIYQAGILKAGGNATVYVLTWNGAHWDRQVSSIQAAQQK